MDLAKLILKNFVKNVEECQKYGFKKIIALVTPYMYKYGQKIHIATQNETFIGDFIGLSENGALLLNTGNETKIIISGEMTKENFI